MLAIYFAFTVIIELAPLKICEANVNVKIPNFSCFLCKYQKQVLVLLLSKKQLYL